MSNFAETMTMLRQRVQYISLIIGVIMEWMALVASMIGIIWLWWNFCDGSFLRIGICFLSTIVVGIWLGEQLYLLISWTMEERKRLE